ncbi:MAG: hypothetical protein LH629_16170, partial [Ignavibacteria bacterium]|nr:hypothetical protein [Ignavibacteria bacterium]
MKIQIQKRQIIVIIFFTAIMFTNCFSKDKTPLETYSLVKIYVHTDEDMRLLQQIDITTEHYTGSIATGIEVVINQEEIYRLKNTGVNYEIKIQDMDSYYLNRPKPSNLELQKSYEIMNDDNIDGFSFGS